MTSSGDLRPDPGTGDDVLVVVVPGLGLDGRSWATVRPLLTRPSTVLTLPSMGRGAGRDADLHVATQARRLVDLLPAGRRVILVGHSASCPVIVHTSALAPAVEGLVLVGPVTDPLARTWPRLVARWLRTAVHERPWEVAPLVAQYRATGPLTMRRGLDRVRRYRTHVAAASCTVPVLVVRGEHDSIAPDAWCRALAERSPGPRDVERVAGGAHMVPLTHPHAVAAAVERLRREVLSRSGAPCATVDAT